MATERDIIQNKIVNLVRDHLSFFPVTYDQNSLSFTATTGSVVPATLRCNETSRTHVEDTQMRRRNARKTDEWTFELILGWNQEVNLDAFIDSLEDPVPFIARSGSHRQIDLHLLACDFEHPVQQQASGGTKATLTFSAVPHRR